MKNAKLKFHSDFAVVVADQIIEDKNNLYAGFITTKKLGNAVTRNRIRRRLKSALRTALKSNNYTMHDLVIIAKKNALYINFVDIVDRLTKILQTLQEKHAK